MIVGIDLGTTNSLVAVWQDGAPKLVSNSLGEVLTPSCVSIDDDGSILIGRAAKERLQSHPEMSASVFKRYMGSDKTVRLGKRMFRAEELSALVLKSLKADAEAFLGEPVTEAVITVPAYFSDAQRKATRTAGVLAGLKVECLLNEPSAAALAYGIHQAGNESRFLVFDLGGGTFDVSILEMFEGVMEVRASAGDNILGGEDITNLLAERFLTHHQLPSHLRINPSFIQRLNAAAESAKRALSESELATMRLVYDNREMTMEISEADLEQVCNTFVKRLRDPIERALRDTNLNANELDSVVLAGGATRMPIIKRLVTRMFGRFPASDINPDEVVALGAAVQAGLKMKDSALSEVVMTDVAPYSIGINVSIQTGNGTQSSGHFSPIIERNSPVPISRVETFNPSNDMQTALQLEIYQGESRLVKDNIHLGSLKLELERLPRHENLVDVRLTYDVNGLIEVQATVQRTGKVQKLIIEGNPGLLSEDEIKSRLSVLENLKMHPRDTMESRTIMARADRLYQLIRGDLRAWFDQQVTDYEHVLNGQDPRQIAAAQRKFTDILDELEQNSRLDPNFH